MDRNERRAMFMDAVRPCQQAPECALRFGTGAELRQAPGNVGGLDGDLLLVHCARFAWLLTWPLAIYHLELTSAGRRVVGRSRVLDFLSIYGLRTASRFLTAAVFRASAGRGQASHRGLRLTPPPAAQ